MWQSSGIWYLLHSVGGVGTQGKGQFVPFTVISPCRSNVSSWTYAKNITRTIQCGHVKEDEDWGKGSDSARATATEQSPSWAQATLFPSCHCPVLPPHTFFPSPPLFSLLHILPEEASVQSPSPWRADHSLHNDSYHPEGWLPSLGMQFLILETCEWSKDIGAPCLILEVTKTHRLPPPLYLLDAGSMLTVGIDQGMANWGILSR